MLSISINQMGIAHVQFNTQRDMALTLCRIQEFYESAKPELRGQYFTLEKFLRLHTTAEGMCSYFLDWGGFNFPRDTWDRFLGTFAGRLMECERLLLEELTLHQRKLQLPYQYIIATAIGSSRSDWLHEYAHGLWYTSPAYRQSALRLLSQLPEDFLGTLKACLHGQGYSEVVLLDEANAYLSTSTAEELTEWYPFTDADTFAIHSAPFVRLLEAQL